MAVEVNVFDELHPTWKLGEYKVVFEEKPEKKKKENKK